MFVYKGFATQTIHWYVNSTVVFGEGAFEGTKICEAQTGAIAAAVHKWISNDFMTQ